MMAARNLICMLNPEEVDALIVGVTIWKVDEGSLLLYRSPGNELRLRACRNVCHHQQGTFIKLVDIENLTSSGCSVVQCTKHGWRLDMASMDYINPPDCFSQDELIVEVDDDGRVCLYEPVVPMQPWEKEARPAQTIHPGEVAVTYFTHACVEMNFNGTILFTDPWLTGPAFSKGWWLLHEPPSDWLDRLSNADMIYISHIHPDHLSYPTLKLLHKRKPHIPIYVGNTSTLPFSKQHCYGKETYNVIVCELGEWQQVSDDLRFMIMHDGIHVEMDTCLLVDYKGHLIMNTVDCSRPNDNILPKDVDLLMSDFAGGATGYPVSFYGGSYTEEWKDNFIKSERAKEINRKVAMAKKVNPSMYLPFAGYYVEAYSFDEYVRKKNKKNNPAQVIDRLNKYAPDVRTWNPKPGAWLDLATFTVTDPSEGTPVFKTKWNFEPYIKHIDKNILFAPFQHPDCLRFYFEWVGLRDTNLVVRVIETDEAFVKSEIGYDFLVDFLDLSFPKERPSRQHDYLEIKARIGVFRETLKFGYLWDNLYLGFQCKILRDPDIFHFNFWNHMQLLLPSTPPDWTKFWLEKGGRVEELNGPDYMLPDLL
ncbi:cytidine monophosphate-N-acetylneuraminic acid hydroxylase-like [Corticium candelabrum]|uniref:cytidine monophosphate-N-acetylneuraminic acid hydroxylase-like n=1 Tax=Corticium candelabrum TaxID=121492 RepID=UPI002E261529|nr:cytidine monophosphate-N-acetylneuraminic acid hydroxylase-like [Corticium candelabrum]